MTLQLILLATRQSQALPTPSRYLVHPGTKGSCTTLGGTLSSVGWGSGPLGWGEAWLNFQVPAWAQCMGLSDS